MRLPTKVLIRFRESWSAVGTAVLEEDPRSGMKLLHLRMTALAQDVYVPVEDIPVLLRDLEEDLAWECGAAAQVGHA